MKSKFFVTLDIDWASEAAIEKTVEQLSQLGIPLTLFSTHSSRFVEECMSMYDVGLHPFFHPDSSHGKTIKETVSTVLDLPHNQPIYRCHRFSCCNTSHKAMAESGMQASSNVCTDLEVVDPFKNRLGLLEVPIFLEDGGYLYRKHSLEIHSVLLSALNKPGIKTLLIHPMHWVVNTPEFNYMVEIKKSVNRDEWNALSLESLSRIEWKQRGIRNFLTELLAQISTDDFLRVDDLLSKN